MCAFFIYTKIKTIAERFHIQKASHFARSKTISVTLLYTKSKTIYFTQWHIYTKSRYFVLRDVFIYRNPDTQFALRFIDKNPDIFVPRFIFEFLKLADGGAF